MGASLDNTDTAEGNLCSGSDAIKLDGVDDHVEQGELTLGHDLTFSLWFRLEPREEAGSTLAASVFSLGGAPAWPPNWAWRSMMANSSSRLCQSLGHKSSPTSRIPILPQSRVGFILALSKLVHQTIDYFSTPPPSPSKDHLQNGPMDISRWSGSAHLFCLQLCFSSIHSPLLRLLSPPPSHPVHPQGTLSQPFLVPGRRYAGLLPFQSVVSFAAAFGPERARQKPPLYFR
eukprot:1388715-Rhodomonas_salina.1